MDDQAPDGGPSQMGDIQPSRPEPGEAVEDMQSLMAAAERGFRGLKRGETIKGTIVRIDPDSVLVDVGMKSEGVISSRELYHEGEEPYPLEVGQQVLVHVLQPESPEGPLLSLRRARGEQAWQEVQELAQTGTTIQATVVDLNKGGALVDIKGLRGFVPVSQIVSLRPQTSSSDADPGSDRLEALRGQRLSLKVLEADRRLNRLVLSERAAVQESRALRKEALLQNLQPGQIRHGRVSNVTSFGAFVDLGGADGLIHVSELSYNRAADPRSVLRPGQEVDVYVLDVRREDGRIALSRKRAMADPWETVDVRYQRGQVVPVTITRLAKFGAFAQIEPGVEGLIHLSELASVAPREPREVVRDGQEVNAKIIHIDIARRRLGLSLRQVEPFLDEYTASVADTADDEPTPSAFESLASVGEALAAAEQAADAAEIEAREAEFMPSQPEMSAATVDMPAPEAEEDAGPPSDPESSRLDGANDSEPLSASSLDNTASPTDERVEEEPSGRPYLEDVGAESGPERRVDSTREARFLDSEREPEPIEPERSERLNEEEPEAVSAARQATQQ